MANMIEFLTYIVELIACTGLLVICVWLILMFVGAMIIMTACMWQVLREIYKGDW